METVSPSLLTFLLNAAWQIPLVTGVAAVACRMMPDGPARLRHAVWVAALLISLALPLASVRAPAPVTANPAPTSAAAPEAAIRRVPAGAFTPLERPLPAPHRTVAFSWGLARNLVWAYAFFVLFRLLRLGWALARTWTIRRGATPASSSPALDAALRLCLPALGLRTVSVLTSARVSGPVAAGAIILPARMINGTSPDVLTTALAHEMAHVARHDFTLKLVYELIALPIAFHPATALIRREIERTREMACDELVTAKLMDPDVYARSIAAIAGALGPMCPTAMPGVFDGDILEERIRRVIERRGGNIKRARLALLGGFSAMAVCIALASGLAISALAPNAALPEMRLAAAAHNRGDFPGAVAHFEKAVAIEPDNLRARLFLAGAYSRLYQAEGRFDADESIPAPLPAKAREQYREVLARDPKNALAMFGVVAHNGPGRFAESRELMLQLIQIDPNCTDAYFTLGVLDWEIALQPMRQMDPGGRASVRVEVLPYIEDGFRALQIALQKDPERSDAMAYMNLLYHSKADLAAQPEEQRQLRAQADVWFKRARAKSKEVRNFTARTVSTLDVESDPPLIYSIPPPPPPPPPPDGLAPPPPPPPPPPKA